MTTEDNIEIVYWCKACGLTSLEKTKQEACVFCQGELKEIGWVER